MSKECTKLLIIESMSIFPTITGQPNFPTTALTPQPSDGLPDVRNINYSSYELILLGHCLAPLGFHSALRFSCHHVAQGPILHLRRLGLCILLYEPCLHAVDLPVAKHC